MRWRSIYLVVGLIPALGTCCPTVWLEITKDSPAPLPSVQIPELEHGPFTIPPSALNRFEVLDRLDHLPPPDKEPPPFTDLIDPKDEANGARARAVRGLTWIRDRYGHTEAKSCHVPAVLLCGGQNTCDGLRLLHPAPGVEAVMVKGRVMAVDKHHDGIALSLSDAVPGVDGEPVNVCLEIRLDLSTTLLSFVHLSDVHVRDPSIMLTDRRLSHQLDWFDALNSFEYDEDLATYNQYLIEAMIATINEAARAGGPDAPKFVIHTGDSIDTGAVSELVRFHRLVDRLVIPLFEELGNHDLFAFGNLVPTSRRDSDRECTPVSALLGKKTWIAPRRLCVDQQVRCPGCSGEDGDLIARPSIQLSRERFMQHFVHDRVSPASQLHKIGRGAYCANTKPMIRNDSYTLAHGFDLGTADDRPVGRKLGYYAFVQPLEGSDRNAVFIELDGEDLPANGGGTHGHLGHAQVRWLRAVLSCVAQDHPRDLVLVFAHQPLSMLDVEPQDRDRADPARSVAHILETSRNVVGYFYGHHHMHAICGDGPAACTSFWEVETASLIEFPQEARLVRIKQIGSGLGFLEITALRERLAAQDSELARYVALARRGAERDFCYTYRETPRGRCSADQRPYRTDGRDTNVRLFFRFP